MTRTRGRATAATWVVAAMVLAGCSQYGTTSEADAERPARTTSTATSSASTSVSGPTSTSPTTATPSTSQDEVNSADPGFGDPCSLEEGLPDCIDPEGDGTGTYLQGGADCVNANPDPQVCADLDGDGTAGYPDGEGQGEGDGGG